MVTVQELLQAAVNADKAGDAEAARKLVEAARPHMAQNMHSAQQTGSAWSEPGALPVIPMPGDSSTPKVDNFGDTIDAATKAPREATAAFAKRTVAPDRTPLQRIGDAGMTALSAAGTTYAFGAGLVGEVLGGSPTNEKKLARDLMMMGEVAAPELAGVSGTTRAGAKAVRAANALEASPTDLQRRARAADDLGITPSLGAGGKVRGMTAATLEKAPVVGGTIAKDAERFVGEIEDVFSRVRNSVGRADGAEGAGEALQAGLKRFANDFKLKSQRLFDIVGEKIAPDYRLRLTSTEAMLSDAKAAFAQNPKLAEKLGLNNWDAIVSEARENGVSWQAVRQLRTSIGEAIGEQRGTLGDESRARLKRLYGSLTEDMETAAKANGSEALSAWKRANAHYRRGAERIEKDLDKLINSDSPERAFEAFANMTKKGSSSANAKRLYRIKASMPSHEWEKVSASIIDRLGRATDGAQNAAGDAFSPSTFLTKWNKMTPEAKSVLLPPAARKEMNKLAQVAEGAKDAGAERNFSNTGTIVTGSLAGYGLGTAPATTALILGGSWASGKALTSPVMLRALNKAARGDAKQLRAIAKGNSPLAEDAATILRLSSAEAAQGGNAANTEPQSIPVAQ